MLAQRHTNFFERYAGLYVNREKKTLHYAVDDMEFACKIKPGSRVEQFMYGNWYGKKAI